VFVEFASLLIAVDVKIVSAVNVISRALNGGVPFMAVTHNPTNLFVVKLFITEKLL